MKVLLFDLDGTLLRSDKTISEKTYHAVMEARKRGYYIGISTSRSENNSLNFIEKISPEIIISSAGAMVSLKGKTIVLEEFTAKETEAIIAKGRELFGDLNISVDTAGEKAEYYCNFDIPETELAKSWGESIYTEFKDFRKPSLKICFEITDPEKAELLHKELPYCDMIHFTDRKSVV